MSNRSTELFHKAHESAEKFDYFVCGVSGALFAYLGQHYVPQKLQVGAPVLEPLSLVCFVLSFVAGLKRIELTTHARRLNAQMLDAGEKAGSMLEALIGGPGPYGNKEGGEVSDRPTVEAARETHLQEKQLIETELEKVTAKALRYYKVRDRLLILGFIMILLAKVLLPYFP